MTVERCLYIRIGNAAAALAEQAYEIYTATTGTRRLSKESMDAEVLNGLKDLWSHASFLAEASSSLYPKMEEISKQVEDLARRVRSNDPMPLLERSASKLLEMAAGAREFVVSCKGNGL